MILKSITQKRTHLCLKATGYHAKKYIQLWRSVSNISFQQNYQICQIIKDKDIGNFSTFDNSGTRYVTLGSLPSRWNKNLNNVFS